MKSATLAFVLGAIGAAALAAPALGSVQGVKLADGDTVTYTFDYESDSGWADIYDCTITVRDAAGKVRFDKTFNLHDERVYCGGVSRNRTATFLYRRDSEGGHTDHTCLELVPGAAPKVVDLKPCGY